MGKFFREGVLILAIITVLSWLIMYFVPTPVFFTQYAPSSFAWLYWLVLIAVVGRGWPGSLFAQKSPVTAGLVNTITWLVLSIATTLFITSVYPAIPLFPVMIWFGILLFGVTLWYAFFWGAYPFGKLSSLANIVIGAVIIFVLTSVIWSTLVTVTVPGLEAFGHGGPFDQDFAFGFMAWIIVWLLVFAFGFQMYPLYKLGEPWGKIIGTIIVVALAYFSWSLPLGFLGSLGLDPTFSIGVAGSIIGWLLYYCVTLGYYPFAKYVQPKRGWLAILVVLGITVVWVPLLYVILQPVLTKTQALGLPFTIWQLGVLFTLHVMPILSLVHMFFWGRVPFTPPGPPVGPEQAVIEDSNADTGIPS